MKKHKETWIPAHNSEDAVDQSIQVFIRSRPLLERDISAGYYSLLAVQPPSQVHLTHPTIRWGGGRFATKTFEADGVFSEDSSNQQVYETMKVKELVTRCVDEPGSQVSILAYGQTGTGKTFTSTAIEGRPIPLSLV